MADGGRPLWQTAEAQRGTGSQAEQLVINVQSTVLTLGGTNGGGLEVVNFNGDPLAAIGSSGCGIVLGSVSFLREPFNQVIGDAGGIQGASRSWASAFESLAQAAQQFIEAITEQTRDWHGASGDAYRRAGREQAQGLTGLGEASKGLAQAVSRGGQETASAKQSILQILQQAVRQIIQIMIEAFAKAWATGGASIGEGIARSVQVAVQAGQQMVRRLQQLVQTFQQIIQVVQQVMEIARSVKDLLEGIGGQATSAREPQLSGDRVGYGGDIASTARDTQQVAPQQLTAGPGTTAPAPGPQDPRQVGGPQLTAAQPGQTPAMAPELGEQATTAQLSQGPAGGAPAQGPQLGTHGAGAPLTSGGAAAASASGPQLGTQAAGAPLAQAPIGGAAPAQAQRLPSQAPLPQPRPAEAPGAGAVAPAQPPTGDGRSSVNGYPLGAPMTTRTVPGTDFRLRVADGPAGDVLTYVAREFHNRVESLDNGVADEGGFNERRIRGGSGGWSNHASGTAIDLNWSEHPQGSRGTFTEEQVAQIRAIQDEVGGVVRWGGDYRTAAVDEMHFEINAPYAEVLAVAQRLGIVGLGMP